MVESRGQASFEYIILLGLFLGMTTLIVYYSQSQVNSYIKDSKTGDAVKSLTRAIDIVGSSCIGTSKVIMLAMPESVEQGYVSGNEVDLSSRMEDTLSDIHYATRARAYGLLETEYGDKYAVLRKEDSGLVSVSPLAYPHIFDSLLLYLDFEGQNSTHIYDAAGIGNNATIESAQCGIAGYIGRCCYFNGSTDVNISLAYSENGLEELSVCFWADMISLDYGGSVLTKGDDKSTGADSYGFRITESGTHMEKSMEFWLNTTASIAGVSCGTIDTDEWNHYCGVFNKSAISIWLNGELCEAVSGVSGALMASGQKIVLGNIYGGANYSNMYLDQVMIYNRTLGNSEIDKLYKTGREP